MITMTKKLITKLKLKPKYKESAYSQAFINREREVAEKLLKRTKVRIEHKTPVYLQQKNRMSDFKRQVIHKKLGLYKKLTEEERILALSIQAVEKKRMREREAQEAQEAAEAEEMRRE